MNESDPLGVSLRQVLDDGAPLDVILERLSREPGPLPRDVMTDVHRLAIAVVGTDPELVDRVADELVRLSPTERNATAATARAIAFRARAEARLFLGRWSDSDRAYRIAVEHGENAQADGLLGQILVGWIGVTAARGERDAVPPLAVRAESLLRAAGDREYLAKLHINLGNTAYHDEAYEDAYREYGLATDILEAIGREDPTWVTVVANRAVACRNTGRIDEARALFDAADTTAHALDLHRFRAQILLNRSNLERDAGDVRTGLRLTRDAQSLLRSLDADDVLAGARLNEVDLLLDLGLARDAGRLAGETALAFDALDLPIDASICRYNAARAAVATGDSEIALPLLADVEVEFRRRRSWPRLASLRLVRATALLNGRRWSDARDEARRALRTFTRRGATRSIADARAVIVRSYLAEGMVASAARERDRLQDVDSLPPGTRAKWRGISARVSIAVNRPEEARRHLERAIEDVETQRQLVPGVELRAAAFRGHQGVYHDLVDLIVASDDENVPAVLRVLDAAKGRAFRDRQQADSNGSTTLGVDRARLGSLTRRVDDIDFGSGPTVDAERRDALIDEIRRIESRLMRHLRAEDESREASVVALSLKAIREAVPPHAVVVEYFLTKTRVFAVVISHAGDAIVTLDATRDSLVDTLARLSHLVDTMAATTTRSFGSLAFMKRVADECLFELHAALIVPLVPHIASARRVLFVPHDVLHHVPFECLYDGKNYLIDTHLVARIPTASFLVESRAPGSCVGAVVAGTITDGPEYVAEELKRVASRLPTSDVRADPSSADILDALASSSIVHLAAHGVLRDDNPTFSHIVTADGGLYVADFLGAEVRSDLVVLSACNTGRIATGGGDDLSAIAHATLAAGAGQLVASQWRVHDEATMEYMDKFYEALAGGALDASAASNRAVADVRSRWEHPFYWGGFAVHGVPRSRL